MERDAIDIRFIIGGGGGGTNNVCALSIRERLEVQ